MNELVFAYYCSGHGYGHATRVSAFCCHLRALPEDYRPQICIVSSAPKHVFADSIAMGAQYRYADIDPVIVQPLAYRVDREKSLEVLRKFLAKKDALLETERAWLVQANVQCVLSDAAFLACLAAKTAGIPSILITNFTFDSVYSYLATTFVDTPDSKGHLLDHLQPPAPSFDVLVPDVPLPHSVLAPLVAHIHHGYQHADLLLRLPGAIPIPSFATSPSLPSTDWVDRKVNMFNEQITRHLKQNPAHYELHDPVPFPSSHGSPTSSLSSSPADGPSVRTLHGRVLPREVRSVPLLVRAPTLGKGYAELGVPSVYTPQGRAALLASLGVPPGRHDPETTKILIVSFGGQVFRRPSNTPSRASSRDNSRTGSPEPHPSNGVTKRPHHLKKLKIQQQHRNLSQPKPPHVNGDVLGLGISNGTNSQASSTGTSPDESSVPSPGTISTLQHNDLSVSCDGSSLPSRASPPAIAPRLATPSHIWIPGAPPASKPLASPPIGAGGSFSRRPSLRQAIVPEVEMIPPTPKGSGFKVSHATTVHVNEIHGSDEDDVDGFFNERETDWDSEDVPQLLPDESWIAVVCGVSKEQWNAAQAGGDADELPDGFYVAPRDIYMPDLTAAGDVLLGKLGYGTVSECVDACTPFVYVSRPLFIEEHGLRLLLDSEGVGVELARSDYEAGDWAAAVYEAYIQGKDAKETRRRQMAARLQRASNGKVKDGPVTSTEGTLLPDDGVPDRAKEGRQMALDVVSWARRCTTLDGEVGPTTGTLS